MATFRDTVEKATVTIWKGKPHGRGVLVEGNLILTAAHCLDCSCDGSMVMSEHLPVEIQTCDGKKLLTNKIAVEPCSDIAVLGSPDNQAFYEEYERFEKFCERTTPLKMFDGFATEIDLDKPVEKLLKEQQFPVHICDPFPWLRMSHNQTSSRRCRSLHRRFQPGVYCPSLFVRAGHR